MTDRKLSCCLVKSAAQSEWRLHPAPCLAKGVLRFFGLEVRVRCVASERSGPLPHGPRLHVARSAKKTRKQKEARKTPHRDADRLRRAAVVNGAEAGVAGTVASIGQAWGSSVARVVKGVCIRHGFLGGVEGLSGAVLFRRGWNGSGSIRRARNFLWQLGGDTTTIIAKCEQKRYLVTCS